MVTQGRATREDIAETHQPAVLRQFLSHGPGRLSGNDGMIRHFLLQLHDARPVLSGRRAG